MAHGEVIAKYKTALHLRLIDAAVAVTDGVWMDAGLYELAKIAFSGFGVGTMQLRASNDASKPADAAHGLQVGADITADALVEILVMPRWIKVRVTVWTSGSLSALAMLRTAR